MQSAIDDAVTVSQLDTKLSDFAAKPNEFLSTGAETYLYWDGNSFVSGQLPDETPVPTENTDDGYILAWDEANKRFINKEVAVTALDAEDVENVAPGSTSNDDQALQWKRVGSIDKFQQRVFITPEKLAEKLPAASQTFSQADFEALQWTGSAFVNRSLGFVKPQELRDRMPSGSSGTTGVVVSDASGNLSNSTDFARKDWVLDYLPGKGTANMTLSSQMLIWNGTALENVTITDVEVTKEDANNVLPGRTSNDNEAVAWDAGQKKFVNREVANLTFVENKIADLDFTRIESGDTSASIWGGIFTVESAGNTILEASNQATIFDSWYVDVKALKLRNTTTVIDGIDVSVTDSKEKLPTSNAVQTYVESALDSFGAALSSDRINDASDNTFVQTNSSAVEVFAGGSQAIVAKADQVEVHQNAIFGTAANPRNVRINGDLYVTGSTTQINVTDLEVQDSNILLNKGAEVGPDGAGISVEGADGSVAAYIQLDESGSFKAWELSTSDGNANISASNGNTFGVYVEGTRKLHVEDGTTSIANDLSVSGATSLATTLSVSGTTTSGGKLTVSSGGLDVTGATTLNDLTTVNNDLTATGRVSSDTLSVSNASTLSGNVTVDNGASLSVAGPTTLTGSVTLGAGFSLGGVNVTAIKDSSDSIAATDLLTANAIKGKLDALQSSLEDQIDGVSGNLDALNLTQIIDGTGSTASSVAVDHSGGTITGTLGGTSVFDANGTRFNVSNELIVADAAQLNSTLNVVGATTVTNLQATSITETSSAALKTNVTAIDGALSKVMALRGVEFNWINNINGSKEYGLIAEDVAQVAPNLVSYEQEEAKGVKYSKMVSLLIEAMKEQQKEIDELKKKLN